MAKWKPFDLTWGRSIYYCTECKEGIEVPTSCGKPMYKFCPMCGARMDTADTPQTDCDTCKYGKGKHRYAHICNECGVGINNYTPQTESTGSPIGDYRDGVGAWQTDCQWQPNPASVDKRK